MALKRRSFYSGATTAPGDMSSGGFDPAAGMPVERPSTPFSPAATPGPRGGGVGGSVDPSTGAQSQGGGPGGGGMPGGGMGAGAPPPGGGSAPIMPGESPMPTPRAFYAPPLAPTSASMYTTPGAGGVPPTPMQPGPMGGPPMATTPQLGIPGGGQETPLVLRVLKALGRL